MKDQLFAAALQAHANAYAPYSNYAVGAAVASESGAIFAGCNVENAVFPLGQCAERVAIQNMVSAGGRRITELLLLTANGATPCGACRQVISEFSEGNLPIYIANADGIVSETTLEDLLPQRFTMG
ncbi:MAG: cytidine deaminase [Fimbriimonadales bacterium]